ncbi:Aminomethyltransferase folate-binding domain-containing protein [Aureobasidium sp. EXF-10728]|nr:Aminomethyltransferase folate-binding domain-containing protein [Aureobasidium sp. EXF-10728]
MAAANPRQPFVCLRRLPKPKRHYSTTTPSTPLPPTPPPSGAAKLSSTRRLISLHGPDAPKFLQGILTNNVNPSSHAPFFAAFLTAQGKVLHDVFVYPTLGSSFHAETNKTDDPGYLVEVDEQQTSTLLKHLKRHKLRSKFVLRVLEQGELDIWASWREDQKWTPYSHSGQHSNIDPQGNICITDTRAPGLGQRLLLPSTTPLASSPSLQGLDNAGITAYKIRRYTAGVPEGQNEIPRDDVLPMNTNLDIMNGIDFKKGCYVGQELTIRTHHTGVVRRRILPVCLFDPLQAAPEKISYNPDMGLASPSPGTEIKIQGKRGKPGKYIAGVGNVGLAMCRLELMTDLQVTAEPSSFDANDRFMVASAGEGEEAQELGIKAFVPDWMKSKIRAPKLQRRVE